MNLPTEFEKRMSLLLGDEYPAFKRALTEGEATKGLITGIKAKKEVIEATLSVKALPYGGYTFDFDGPGKHPLHHAGAFYVQDPSAIATGASIAPEAGWRVLDTCASPGGKSISYGSRIGDSGLLISNEISASRAKVLASNIERMGLKNTIVTNLPTDALGRMYRGYFDLVIADVPCSGEGMFRKYPEALSGWNPGMVDKCATLGKEILENVYDTVKGGGYLLFSTCTFSPKEDEEQIEAFLAGHPDFTLWELPEALKAVTAPGIGGIGRRFYPHISEGEGQYICLLKRTSTEEEDILFKNAGKAPSPADMDILNAFLRENTDIDPASLAVYACRDGLRALSDAHPMAEKGVFAYGVNLGRVEKGIFHPHHQLFSAYGHRFRRKADLDEAKARLYLTGNVVPYDIENGWCAVTYLGAALGGGKASGGIIKNHYPKGLRN